MPTVASVGASTYSYAVLVDTGAFLGRADPGDAHHRTALETFEGLAQAELPLVVTRPTIWEAYKRVRYDLGYSRAREMLEFIAAKVEIVEFQLSDDADARTLLDTFKWAKLSFIDALNFTIMNRLGLKTAFTYDVNDYSMLGFEVVPRLL